MNLAERINGMVKLGSYMMEDSPGWRATKQKASEHNPWFTIEFIDLAVKNIVTRFLQKRLLEEWAHHYYLDDNISPKNIGVVMAGNIQLVGFHDMLCVFIAGHKQTIKLSSKDNILLKHLVEELARINPHVSMYISFAEMLKGCDAYIATGSSNTARYFDYYFGRYPSIIRHNRTSVAILKGNENPAQLEALADDVHLYFGLGCRNVTKIFVPEGYDFVPLLAAFKNYGYFADHSKYRNNYDYCLSLHIMNNKYYMTNESLLLIESEELFSPISQLNYSYYKDIAGSKASLKEDHRIQCIAGGEVEFGETQNPGLFTYADGVDTIQFLLEL